MLPRTGRGISPLFFTERKGRFSGISRRAGSNLGLGRLSG